MSPVNSFTFPPSKTATQSHSQTNMLLWLDFLCDNLVYPCNTPPEAEACWQSGFSIAVDQPSGQTAPVSAQALISSPNICSRPGAGVRPTSGCQPQPTNKSSAI